jgi:GrpB-like predicted nucleotidyltransferase (UPF0157 family)
VIKVVPYDAVSPVAFEAEAHALCRVLGAHALRVEHVGSTAVPGLDAKPVIDIQVSVASLQPHDPLVAALAILGYRFISLGDFDAVYPFFAKPERGPSTHHVHLCVAGEEQEAKHLAFRDCLRRQPDKAAAYSALKHQLAALHHGLTFESQEAYSLSKTAFVESVLESAGFKWSAQQ